MAAIEAKKSYVLEATPKEMDVLYQSICTFQTDFQNDLEIYEEWKGYEKEIDGLFSLFYKVLVREGKDERY